MKNTDICKPERMIDSITELFSASCEFSHGKVAKNKHKQTVCCKVWSDVRSPFFTQRTKKRVLQTSRPFFGMLLTICCLSTSCSALPDKLRIGALFEPEYESQKRAFEYAVQSVNFRTDILDQVLVLHDDDVVQPGDSFSAQRKVCRMVNYGVAAIFGPVTSYTAAHVQSICNAFEIPHIQWHWDGRDVPDYFSISLFPHYLTLSTAYRDIISYWGWNRFAVLYEENAGLTRMQEVLTSTEGTPARVTVRKMTLINNDFVSMLKHLKNNGEYRFIIDCKADTVRKFLYAALKVRMISELFHYFFTTLDLGLINLEDFRHGGANITAFRLINPDNPLVVSIRTEWLIFAQHHGRSPLMDHSEIKMEFEGLSGKIEFDNGQRRDFRLDLLHLTDNGLEKFGTWDRKIRLNITETKNEQLESAERLLTKSTLKVAVVVDPPYVVRDTRPLKERSTSGYRGFCIDLLDKIAETKGFNYTLYEVNTYGIMDENGTWNGIMAELINRRADIGLAGITITYAREQYVDFTKPYLTLGITILYRKPEPTPPKLFSFLSPLSIEVWVYMIAAYLCVSFMLFVIARFSPYEWYNPHPCNPDSDEVENQFTILNSLWFTIGSLMQQGCEIAPRAISTRLVAGIWWFFTLILISSYTANLAAFLTVERMVSDIASAEDLVNQVKIKYGTFKGGSTSLFFEQSKYETYKRMWNFMSMQEDVFVSSSEEGIKRVKQGDYAYLAESTAVDYAVFRDCDLMKIGANLDSKGYGIATPTGSPQREIFTKEILRLTEQQTVHDLKTKWWRRELGAKDCAIEDRSKRAAAELGVENVGGVFVVLLGGVVAGLFVVIVEFLWKAKNNAKKDQQSLCSEIAEEFRFAIRCSRRKTNKLQVHDYSDHTHQLAPLTHAYGANNSVGSKNVFA